MGELCACFSRSFGDHYEWNKVTSCIHNILSGQRWIEHYGEMAIKNKNSNVCQCKVTFVKVKKEMQMCSVLNVCFLLQMGESGGEEILLWCFIRVLCLNKEHYAVFAMLSMQTLPSSGGNMDILGGEEDDLRKIFS